MIKKKKKIRFTKLNKINNFFFIWVFPYSFTITWSLISGYTYISFLRVLVYSENASVRCFSGD